MWNFILDTASTGRGHELAGERQKPEKMFHGNISLSGCFLTFPYVTNMKCAMATLVRLTVCAQELYKTKNSSEFGKIWKNANF